MYENLLVVHQTLSLSFCIISLWCGVWVRKLCLAGVEADDQVYFHVIEVDAYVAGVTLRRPGCYPS